MLSSSRDYCNEHVTLQCRSKPSILTQHAQEMKVIVYPHVHLIFGIFSGLLDRISVVDNSITTNMISRGDRGLSQITKGVVNSVRRFSRVGSPTKSVRQTHLSSKRIRWMTRCVWRSCVFDGRVCSTMPLVPSPNLFDGRLCPRNDRFVNSHLLFVRPIRRSTPRRNAAAGDRMNN
jgi:hypothetical protein